MFNSDWVLIVRVNILIISEENFSFQVMGELKMKVLGISGSPRKSHTTEGLVKAILAATGLETEFNILT